MKINVSFFVFLILLQFKHNNAFKLKLKKLDKAKPVIIKNNTITIAIITSTTKTLASNSTKYDDEEDEDVGIILDTHEMSLRDAYRFDTFLHSVIKKRSNYLKNKKINKSKTILHRENKEDEKRNIKSSGGISSGEGDDDINISQLELINKDAQN